MRLFKTFGVVGLIVLLLWASTGMTVRLRECREKCCTASVPNGAQMDSGCHEKGCCKPNADGGPGTKCPRNCCQDEVYRIVLDNLFLVTEDVSTTADWNAPVPTLLPCLAKIQWCEHTFSWNPFTRKHPPPRSGQKRRLEMCSFLC